MTPSEKDFEELPYATTAAPSTSVEAISDASSGGSCFGTVGGTISLVSSSFNFLAYGSLSQCFGTLYPQDYSTADEPVYTEVRSQEPLSDHDVGSVLPQQSFQPAPLESTQPLNPYPVGSGSLLEQDSGFLVSGVDGPSDLQPLPSYVPAQPILYQPAQPQPPFPLEEMRYPQPGAFPNQDSWTQNSGFDHGYYTDAYVAPTQETLVYGPYPASIPYPDTAQVPHDTVKPRNRDRQPFQTVEARQETAITRAIGACTRCKAQHIRCLLNFQNSRGPCMTCQKVTTPRYSSRIICVRARVTDIKLFKTSAVAGMERTLRWSKTKSCVIDDWASGSTKILQITEGYCANPVSLEVRQFVPVRGDRIHVQWAAEGVKRTVDVPPYAIVDIQRAEKCYRDFINAQGAEFVKAALDGSEPFIRQTYDITFHIANRAKTPMEEVKLVKDILRLWVAIRLNTRSTIIVGDETLGMRNDILDSTSPLHGKIPIPPVMSAQIELLLQAMQEKLRTDVLNSLQKLITKKPCPWFMLYICTFILLHNCAMVTKHDASYARKYGMKRRFAREDMVVEYHYGANLLLDHWHRLNKGKQPFSQSMPMEDVVQLIGLDKDEERLVELTRRHVRAKANHFKRIRDLDVFEDDYYFLAQLYDENWVARPTF